jgi:rubrerythrin
MPSGASKPQAQTWRCGRCSTIMESSWWTCSTCGKMKDDSQLEEAAVII